MLQRSILCMQGTQYATKRSILCRGAFCGPTAPNDYINICFLAIHYTLLLVFITKHAGIYS